MQNELQVTSLQPSKDLLDRFVVDTLLLDRNSRLAENSARAAASDLRNFAYYIQQQSGVAVGELHTDLAAWSGLGHSHVKTYIFYLLREGYAITTINRHLSSIKAMVGLAAQAGQIDSIEAGKIKLIQGYGDGHGQRVDEKRAVTRLSSKKTEATVVLPYQAHALKRTGPARDRLIFCLLFDHALRVGEVTLITTEHVTGDSLLIHRTKTQRKQIHTQTHDTANALALYIQPALMSAEGAPLFINPRTGLSISTDTIRRITQKAGLRVGVKGLTPHDARHYFATQALRSGTDIHAVQEAGDWKSMAALQRYLDSKAVTNLDVVLP